MKKNKTMIFLFILPTVLCLLFMYVYPVVRTVIMSFFKVESLTASTSTWSFYGLQNYFKILRNAGFISSMKNMVMIWLVGGIITMCLSMLMAVILTSGIRGAKFFKAAIYMPNIISAVALATMWIQYVFNYDYGLLNQIVKAFGGENVRWLGTDLIFWAMMIAFIFGSVGYYMLIFISGIEGIPQRCVRHRDPHRWIGAAWRRRGRLGVGDEWQQACAACHCSEQERDALVHRSTIPEHR